VSFAAITLCVASQPVFIVVVYFVIDSVRKLLDTPSYVLLVRLPPFWVAQFIRTTRLGFYSWQWPVLRHTQTASYVMNTGGSFTRNKSDNNLRL
jgi:hypothetical protein